MYTNFTYFTIKFIVRPPFFIMYPYKKYFEGKKKYKGGSIVVCNHQSAVDVPIIGAAAPYRTLFLAKKELFKGLKKRVLLGLGAVPVDRGNVGTDSLKTVVRLLKQGRDIVIFPEGTRVGSDGEIHAIKDGAAMFALMAKVPIRPLYIDKKARLFRRTRILFGKEIVLDENLKADKEGVKFVSNLIAEELNRLKGKMAEIKKGKAKKEKDV